MNSGLECENILQVYLKIYQGYVSNCRVSCFCHAWNEGKLVRSFLAWGLAAKAVPGAFYQGHVSC